MSRISLGKIGYGEIVLIKSLISLKPVNKHWMNQRIDTYDISFDSSFTAAVS